MLLAWTSPKNLIQILQARAPDNVEAIIGDVLEINFQPASFHRILFAAALQHFSHAQAIRLFKKLANWLQPSGILLITDILDVQRKWNFFNSLEREEIYFRNTMEGTPVLGTWFDRVWLEKLARNAGFKRAKTLDQPKEFWYSHYRIDLLCQK